MEIAYETIQAFQKVITGDSLDKGGSIAPYRSGPELVRFFNLFGEKDEYGQGFPSRWYYAEEKLKRHNGSEKLKEILEASVDPRHFLDSTFDVAIAVDFLNQHLEYDGLVLSRSGKFYKIFSLEDSKENGTKELTKVDNTESVEEDTIVIFISHSSADLKIVDKLVELLRISLRLTSHHIRCTSLDGYRLPGGASTNEQLKEEIYNSKSFIGLITPNSLESKYVLFELGARWGAKRQLIPLLAGGAVAKDLVGPLAEINALSCSNKSQMFQLIGELSAFLETETEKVELYAKMVDNLIDVS
jgi:hypothetical protein